MQGPKNISFDQTLNNFGHISKQTIATNQTVRPISFNYEDRGYLSEENTVSGDKQWTYDDVGIRNANISGWNFDALGRVISSPQGTFIWSASGAISEAKVGAKNIHYLYDANEQRIAKYVNHTLDQIYFDNIIVDGNHLVQIVELEGYVLGFIKDGVFTEALTDLRGSIIDPESGGWGTAQKHEFSRYLHYAGSNFDEDIGMVRFGLRDYSPELGRFISPDFVFLENPELCKNDLTSCNLFSYAKNDPLRFVDPTGDIPLDTFADVAFIASDIVEAYRDPSRDNFIALGLDVLGASIPFVTGLGKAYKAGANGVDLARVGNGHTSKKGRYENPGHHDPSNSGPNPYTSTKSVLPKNHKELWDKSVESADGSRWTKVGNGKKAEYHRFQNDRNGNWHWNGSTSGVTKGGQSRPILPSDIPNDIKKLPGT